MNLGQTNGEDHIGQIQNSIVHPNSIEKKRKSLVKQELATILERRRREELKLREEHSKYLEHERDNFIITKIQQDTSILLESEKITNSETSELKTRLQLQRDERYQQVIDLRNDYGKKLTAVSFESILKSQAMFKKAHQRAVKHFMAIDKDKIKDFEEYTKSMKGLINGFESIISRIKMGDLKAEDVKIAEHFFLSMEKLEKSLEMEIQKLSYINEPEKPIVHLPKVETPVIIEKSTPAFKADEQENVVITTDASVGFSSPESFTWYSAVMTLLARKESIIKELNSEESLKKYRSNLQKTINTSVNTISAVSPHHMKDKFVKLFELLAGNIIQTSDGPISASEHNAGKDYCMVLLAKKFVSQSQNDKALFPIAAIITSLWQYFPEFGMLFLACLYKDCPFLVPYFPPHFEGQSVEDYYKACGYRISDGNVETKAMYLDRQKGIARLFAAILIAEPQNNGTQNPFGVENGWRWLCDILNLDPLPDICATMIKEFLQIAGFDMWKIYKGQFIKLLQLIKQQYFPKLDQIEEGGGPKSRLDIFLNKSLKDGIEKPTETLPRNFF